MTKASPIGTTALAMLSVVVAMLAVSACSDAGTPVTYTMTVQLYDEDTFRELTPIKCEQKTGPGEPYFNVPSATYSLVDSTGDTFGVMFPDGLVSSCTFQYSIEMIPEEMPDLLLVRGPRMQQNGFPARKVDFTEAPDGSILMLDLSLGVDLSY